MSEEFRIQKIQKMKHVNSDITKFREENPNYEIYNMNVTNFGGGWTSTRVWVIWRIKK